MVRSAEGAGVDDGVDSGAGWHASGIDEVQARLGASDAGLSAPEAAERLRRWGPNQLEARPPVSAWTILVAQFRSVVVLLLVLAAVGAFLLGDRLESAAIVAVLLVNTAIGFPVELRARRAMEALLQHQVHEATVIREGRPRRIPATGLVPGDLIEVAEGEAVPADARLVDSAGVRTTEAALTGESVPVEKSAEATAEPDTPLAERANMIHAGTAVAVGTARALVVATGMNTELGRIGRLIESVADEETPLERRLDALGARLVRATLGVAVALAGVGILRGFDPLLMVEMGIALAIAAVPEGLPVVATIALAIGLRRMARRNASVRRPSSVEALGSTTVVCTDKTGTLTAGEMTATVVVTAGAEVAVTGTGYDTEGALELEGTPIDPRAVPGMAALLLGAALTARVRIEPDGEVIGDPTDAALLVLARKGGTAGDDLLVRQPLLGEIPFTSESRLSASLHGRESDGARDAAVAWIKGAPGAVLARCTALVGENGLEPLDDARRASLEARNDALAAEGLRVIALARAEGVDPASARDAAHLPKTATFLGLVGILDPPAEGVAETIATLRTAGIRVVMITGDQAPTAAAIARQLGLEVGDPLNGRDLAALDESALRDAVARTAIFSRTSPADKLRVVEALRHSGEIVAVLGDGVNDAAALKQADVGVAMGIRGTDVAKEVADVVLRDDRFGTIGAAVEEGRVIFENIRKFVFYLFSCNVAEVLVVAGGSLAGLPLPLLPLQILWLNLVTDTFPALALAIEPGDPGVMKRRPRPPEAAILSRRFVGTLLFYAALITAVTLGVFLWGLRTGPLDRAVTLAFATLAFAQLFHLGTARARTPVLRPARAFANRWALGAVALVVGLQGLAIYWPPLASMLGTVPLSAPDAATAVGLAMVPAAVGQVIRLRPTSPRRTSA
ncbi:cation-translocating P-type ATPase [Gaopeijia maritima]|uniref:cation-translocating P-type ATPase n=1 Tax=Gaopeijia maritima TaxID=3119007 RepID=UPI0032949055